MMNNWLIGKELWDLAQENLVNIQGSYEILDQYLLKLADLQSIKGTSFNKCWITEWIFDFPLWKNYEI